MFDHLHDEDGVSLVELLVAMVVLSVVLTALAASLVNSLQAVQAQERRFSAVATMNTVIEQLQSVDFDDATMCDTEVATAYPGGTFEGEEVVVDPDVCSDPDRFVPSRNATSPDGVAFTIDTAVTWSDEAADGTGAADADGVTQDLKRFVVDLTWNDRGQARTARSVTFRTAGFAEQPFALTLVPATGDFVPIADGTQDGANTESFVFTLTSETKLTSVKVSWLDRFGGPRQDTLVATASDGKTWKRTISANVGPFVNGGTLFTAEVTMTDGTTDKIATRGLFLYDLGIVQVSRTFTDLLVDAASGLVCPGQVLTLDTRGAIKSDVVTGSWSQGPVADSSFLAVVGPADIELDGARFQLDLTGSIDFATIADGVSNGVDTTLTTTVARTIDNETLTRTDTIRVREVASC